MYIPHTRRTILCHVSNNNKAYSRWSSVGRAAPEAVVAWYVLQTIFIFEEKFAIFNDFYCVHEVTEQLLVRTAHAAILDAVGLTLI